MSSPASVGTPITYTTMVEDQARKKWRTELTGSKQQGKKKTSFRLRPSLNSKINGKPSLLSRRAETNVVAIEASNAHTLFPNPSNTIDLVTPEPTYLTSPPKPSSSMPSAAMDSGYYSGPSSASKMAISPQRVSSATVSLPSSYTRASPPPALSSNISEYRTGMYSKLDSQFFKKVVKKEYPNDPKKAYEDLQPVMRHMLEKPEDRQVVQKLYIICNFRNSTIRGERRMVSKPRRKAGHRLIMGGSPEQMTWYFGPKVGYT